MKILGLVLLFVGFALSESIKRIGNKITPSTRSFSNGGFIILLNDVSTYEGVAFGFSAYFITNSSVAFQIWHPVMTNNTGSDSSSFELIGELEIRPSVVNSTEDVYFRTELRPNDCVRVRKGDRVGVYFREAPGAISYFFNSEDPQAFSKTLVNSSDPYTIGDVVSFDALVFPYAISVAAYIDTNITNYSESNQQGYLIECPEMYIPSEIPTTPSQAPSGSVGVTGPYSVTGPPGITCGPPGPPEPSRGQDGESVSKVNLMKERLVIGLLVSLIIVTLILLILIIVICVMCRRKQPEQPPPTSNKNGCYNMNITRSHLASNSPSEADSQYATISGENEHQYSLDTSERDSENGKTNIDGNQAYYNSGLEYDNNGHVYNNAKLEYDNNLANTEANDEVAYY